MKNFKEEWDDEDDCEENDDYLENFKVFSQAFARRSINLFFDGLPICRNYTLEHMSQDKFCNLIVNLSFDKAIDIGYEIIGNTSDNTTFLVSGKKHEDSDVGIFLEVNHRASRLKIPKEYLGGIFLMWLHFCEGVEIKMFS